MHTLSSPDIQLMPDEEFYQHLIETVAPFSSQRHQFLMYWRDDCLSPKEAAEKAGYKHPTQSANQFLRDPQMLYAADLLSEKLRREHGAVSLSWIMKKYRHLLDGAVKDKQWAAARGILADIAKHSGHAPEDRITVEHTGTVKHSLGGIDPNDLKAVAQLHERIARTNIEEREVGPNAQRSGDSEATVARIPAAPGAAAGAG